MFRNLEKNLLNIFVKISVKAILLFIVLNIIVSAASYIYLDKIYKQTPTWIGQVKFLIPKYTKVIDENYVVSYHEILPQTMLLENFTERRKSGNLLEMCKIKQGHFDDHVFYKWSQTGSSNYSYNVTLNVRHDSSEKVQNCVDEFKRNIEQSFNTERLNYINLVVGLIEEEKKYLEITEKEYLEMLQFYDLSKNWEGTKSSTENNLNLSSTDDKEFKFNISLFNLQNTNRTNMNKIKRKISMIEHEVYEINKNLEVKIEFDNLQKKFRDFRPLLVLINLIFSFFVIFIFLILTTRESNFKN
jgi:hypothetical protein